MILHFKFWLKPTDCFSIFRRLKPTAIDIKSFGFCNLLLLKILHQSDEIIKKIIRIFRAWTCFWVILN